jgi:hypothetical protein
MIDNLVKEDERLDEQIPLTPDGSNINNSEIVDKSDAEYLRYVDRK